jgi:crotonobetainyl-CoA:carnitine CoA-transferase CaiB-like acyl-CoA transferase
MSALEGIRVVELANERCAFAGKLMGDMGADVVLVEKPGGDPTRRYPPFAESESGGGNDPGLERSLYWWHYNTSKRGIVLDIDSKAGRAAFERLIATADVLLESEAPGRLTSLGLDYSDLESIKSDLIHVSITPFGRETSRRNESATDLTILAGGGPVWSCGYDDHSIPPIRGGGNQGYQIACHYAVLSALTAIFHHGVSGEGQFIDVSMHAAANITTEMASYFWLVEESTVVRQTGRHAMPMMTMPTQILCADGRYACSGVPPRTPKGFGDLYDWLERLGLVPHLPEALFLDQARDRDSISFDGIGVDEEITAIFSAAREAINLIASRLPAIEFFEGAQKRGITVEPFVIPAPRTRCRRAHGASADERRS